MLQTFKANLKGNHEQAKDSQLNKKTLAALKEIETGGGKVFENVEERISS
jgi:hypothetical protein